MQPDDTLEVLLEELRKRNNPALTGAVRSSKPASIEDLIREIRLKFPGSNAAESPGLYANSGSKLRKFPQELTANGFVLRPQPDTAFVQKDAPIGTPIHELAHTQQLRSGDTFSGLGYPGEEARGRLWTDKEWSRVTLGTELDRFANSKENKDRLERKDSRAIGLNAGHHPKEILATLQEIEGQLPAGKTVFDEEPWASIFKDAYLRRLYEQKMFPMSDKMFSSDYPFRDDPTTLKGLIALVQRNIRNWTAR